MNRPPYTESTAISALYAHAQGIAQQVGLALPKQHRGGGSDGNFTAALGIPTLDGLGAAGEGAHAVNESILIDRIADRTALLAKLLAAPLAQA